MEPVFLSLDEVLEIHEQQIERYGGSSGLRDAAGLDSAVAMATFGGEFLHTSIPDDEGGLSFSSFIYARTTRSSMATNEWGQMRPSRSC